MLIQYLDFIKYNWIYYVKSDLRVWFSAKVLQYVLSHNTLISLSYNWVLSILFNTSAWQHFIIEPTIKNAVTDSLPDPNLNGK